MSLRVCIARNLSTHCEGEAVISSFREWPAGHRAPSQRVTLTGSYVWGHRGGGSLWRPEQRGGPGGVRYHSMGGCCASHDSRMLMPQPPSTVRRGSCTARRAFRRSVRSRYPTGEQRRATSAACACRDQQQACSGQCGRTAVAAQRRHDRDSRRGRGDWLKGRARVADGREHQTWQHLARYLPRPSPTPPA